MSNYIKLTDKCCPVIIANICKNKKSLQTIENNVVFILFSKKETYTPFNHILSWVNDFEAAAVVLAHSCKIKELLEYTFATLQFFLIRERKMIK